MIDSHLLIFFKRTQTANFRCPETINSQMCHEVESGETPVTVKPVLQSERVPTKKEAAPFPKAKKKYLKNHSTLVKEQFK